MVGGRDAGALPVGARGRCDGDQGVRGRRFAAWLARAQKVEVPAATCAMTTEVAALAMPGMP